MYRLFACVPTVVVVYYFFIFYLFYLLHKKNPSQVLRSQCPSCMNYLNIYLLLFNGKRNLFFIKTFLGVHREVRGVWQEHITFWEADLNKGEAACSFLGERGRKERVDLNFAGGTSFMLLLTVSQNSESSPNMYYKISRPENKK